MNERVATLSIAKPRQRIYMELMRLAVPDPRGGGAWLIEPVPQHNEIASWAGVDEVEVAQAIGTLAREKIIERKNRTLIIHDRAKIHEMSAM
jgi:CRP-like cAMP-binding protein